MSDNRQPAMRFARRLPSAGAGERFSFAESARRRTNEESNRIAPRRAVGYQSGNGDSVAGPWTRPENKILLVHGLEHLSINCDHIFNLFCIYGNVSTVKILKDNKVLVELESVESATRCLANLHLMPLDNRHKLNVKYSKHTFIYESTKINRLPDGTPTMKIYSKSRFYRFPTARNEIETRRPAAPCKILHFYNAPTDVSGVKIHKAISDAIDGNTQAVQSIVILPKKEGAKCSTGLIKMNSVHSAARVVSLLNHMKLESTKSRFPFIIKLCFSKWTEIKPKHGSPAVLLGTAPRRPWIPYGSDNDKFATEFSIAQTTRLASGGHACMLWRCCQGDRKENLIAKTDQTTPPADGQQNAATGCEVVGDDVHLSSGGVSGERGDDVGEVRESDAVRAAAQPDPKDNA